MIDKEYTKLPKWVFCKSYRTFKRFHVYIGGRYNKKIAEKGYYRFNYNNEIRTSNTSKCWCGSIN